MTIREACDIATKKLREFNNDQNLKVEVCYRELGYCYSVHVEKFDKGSWITIDNRNEVQEQIDLIVKEGKEFIESFSKEVKAADEMFAELGFVCKKQTVGEPIYFDYIYKDDCGGTVYFDCHQKGFIVTHEQCEGHFINMQLFKAISQKIKELGW